MECSIFNVFFYIKHVCEQTERYKIVYLIVSELVDHGHVRYVKPALVHGDATQACCRIDPKYKQDTDIYIHDNIISCNIIFPPFPPNRNSIQSQFVAFRLTYTNDTAFKAQYPIHAWNVTRVTDMSHLFENQTTFNENINDWDVSNVTNMSYMFSGCNAFNQPLDQWNTSNVSNMNDMFNSCVHFDQPLGNWDTSRVNRMARMFNNCTAFNQPLNDWNVSNVETMSFMFFGCVHFNQPLDKWNVSKVKAMMKIFAKCTSFNQPLNMWEISPGTLGLHTMFEPTYPFELMPASARTQQSRQTPPQPVEATPSSIPQVDPTPPTQSQLPHVTLNLSTTNTCFDLIEGETTIETVLQEENKVFVFYTNDINGSQRVSIPTRKMQDAIKDTSYLVYECRTPDTMQDIDRNTKYFNIKKLTGFGDVVLYNDMLILASNHMTHLFAFKKTTKELATTASHDVLFGSNPNYVGDRHCQTGQNASVYQLVPKVIYTCGASTGGKQKTFKRKYNKTTRKSKRRKRNTRKRKLNN